VHMDLDTIQKKRSFVYGPKKTTTDEEEKEWQNNKFRKAISM
jgi:hypothetical protein